MTRCINKHVTLVSMEGKGKAPSLTRVCAPGCSLARPQTRMNMKRVHRVQPTRRTGHMHAGGSSLDIQDVTSAHARTTLCSLAHCRTALGTATCLISHPHATLTLTPAAVSLTLRSLRPTALARLLTSPCAHLPQQALHGHGHTPQLREWCPGLVRRRGLRHAEGNTPAARDINTDMHTHSTHLAAHLSLLHHRHHLHALDRYYPTPALRSVGNSWMQHHPQTQRHSGDCSSGGGRQPGRRSAWGARA